MFWIALILNAAFLLLAALFTWESVREKEPRASGFGAAGILFYVLLGLLILLVPPLRVPAGVLLGAMALLGLIFLLPGRPNTRALKGSAGFLVGRAARPDERDVVFARNRSLPPGSDVYRRYYEMHPEREAGDARRRAAGGPLARMGAIDREHPPNVAMIRSLFAMPGFLGPQAQPPPAPAKTEIDPARATRILKGLARHLGADLVGICRVNPRWAYSHRGEIFYDNWDDWGREIADPLPFAVVIATEMDSCNVAGAPHTPAVVETGVNYAKGAFITTELALWLAALGYRAVAHHSRHYDLLMVPLAIDAGLGEYGRLGYLIADRFGPRVRLFAVTTELPLVPDRPVDLGAEVFCERCLKCAECCPSRSIPTGKKTVLNGLERWKLNAETCFDYWGKVGTDCSVCMGVCPFSRPNRSVHRLIRWVLKRSALARRLLPPVDNLIYGRKWRSRKVPGWIRYPKAGAA